MKKEDARGSGRREAEGGEGRVQRSGAHTASGEECFYKKPSHFLKLGIRLRKKLSFPTTDCALPSSGRCCCLCRSPLRAHRPARGRRESQSSPRSFTSLLPAVAACL